MLELTIKMSIEVLSIRIYSKMFKNNWSWTIKEKIQFLLLLTKSAKMLEITKITKIMKIMKTIKIKKEDVPRSSTKEKSFISTKLKIIKSDTPDSTVIHNKQIEKDL